MADIALTIGSGLVVALAWLFFDMKIRRRMMPTARDRAREVEAGTRRDSKVE